MVFEVGVKGEDVFDFEMVDEGKAGAVGKAQLPLTEIGSLPDSFYVRNILKHFIFCNYREVEIFCC
ncbi:MAG: hypothetical protein HZA15_14300 [Nitrospirae bacterium]|nr:hypothetical protein [Nitrospirota bacterium]